MSTEIVKVPDLGDSSDVEVIELLVSVGQKVAENDSLLVLESDKAAMEIPAPFGGVVKSIAVNLGDQVSTGTEIVTLEVDGDASQSDSDSSEESKSDPENEKSEKKEEPQKNEKAEAGDDENGDDGKQKDDSKQQKDTSAASGKETGETDKKPVKSSGSSTEVLEIPDLGGENDVEVIEVHVAVGDQIKVDDALITLESDKAAMEVPAAKAGEVKSLKIKLGDKVSMGSPILELLVQKTDTHEDADEKETSSKANDTKSSDSKTDESASSDAEKSTQSTAARKSDPDTAKTKTSPSASVYAGPAVRKLARELGVDLAQVPGSGARGRIIKEDIHEFVKGRLTGGAAGMATSGSALIPDQDFSQYGEIEEISLSKMHKVTAVNMHRNWSAVPHVAQFNEADVTELEDFREQQKAEAESKGVKLTFLPFLLKACAKCLQNYPQFNVSLHSSGEYLIQKKYIHIGMAVATDAGLVVPVIRDVDQKSVWQLAEDIIALSKKAKDRKLSREDMQGACFTISSLGAIGGTGFIPIINAPEVAILGVGKTDVKPVFDGESFVPRKMLPLTLSYDHRAVNGVDGGMFSSYLVKLLGDIRLLLL